MYSVDVLKHIYKVEANIGLRGSPGLSVTVAGSCLLRKIKL